MIIFIIIVTVFSKAIQLQFGSHQIRGKSIQLEQFTIGPGRGEIIIQARFMNEMARTGEVALIMNTYTIDQMLLEEQEKECENKQAISEYKDKVYIYNDGRWSAGHKRLLIQPQQPQIWIIKVSDCQWQIPHGAKIEIYITFRNNGQPLSYEYQFMHYIYITQACLGLLFITFILKRLAPNDKRREIVIALTLDIFANGFQLLDIIMQILYAQGIILINNVGLTLNFLLQSVLICVFMKQSKSRGTFIFLYLLAGIADLTLNSNHILNRDFGFLPQLCQLLIWIHQQRNNNNNTLSSTYLLHRIILITASSLFIPTYYKYQFLTIMSILINHCLLIFICFDQKQNQYKLVQ